MILMFYIATYNYYFVIINSGTCISTININDILWHNSLQFLYCGIPTPLMPCLANWSWATLPRLSSCLATVRGLASLTTSVWVLCSPLLRHTLCSSISGKHYRVLHGQTQLLPGCICFSCCSPRLCPPQLLLPAIVSASAAAPWLCLLALAAAPRLCQLEVIHKYSTKNSKYEGHTSLVYSRPPNIPLPSLSTHMEKP